MATDERVARQMSRLSGVYRDPMRVTRDVSHLLKHPVGCHLFPIPSTMFENDGTMSTVMVLQGTIAICYRGNTYQILMDMYLPKRYPMHAPVAYVRLPSTNMYLKENHKHVGSTDGRVYMPYLHEWNSNTHNLIDLVIQMSSVFSAEPPVFTKQSQAATTNTSSVTSAATSAAVSAGQGATTGGGGGGGGGGNDSFREGGAEWEAAQIKAYQALEQKRQKEAEEEERRRKQREEEERLRKRREEEEAERQRKREEEERERQIEEQRRYEERMKVQARTRLDHKLQRHVREISLHVRQQAQSDQSDRQRLQLVEEQKLEPQIEYYKNKKDELRRHLDEVKQRKEDARTWLEEYRSGQAAGAEANGGGEEKAGDEESKIDSAVVPSSVLQEQMLELAAENASIDDALYFLDNALYQHGAGDDDNGDDGRPGTGIDCKTHLKYIRKLSKRQFLLKAQLLKINQILLTSGGAGGVPTRR